MTRLLALSFRLAVTLATVAAAVVVGLGLWDYYMDAPWTRDGRVRAADSDGSRPPIPTRSRPAFRFDAGHHSEMKPATR